MYLLLQLLLATFLSDSWQHWLRLRLRLRPRLRHMHMHVPHSSFGSLGKVYRKAVGGGEYMQHTFLGHLTVSQFNCVCVCLVVVVCVCMRVCVRECAGC